ncbi:MarR family winged helix-turn-helix transcriptional regulator [Brevibacillus dissolubilis]|uniref:MarR family winged helix-turn-helix transcriptional regulator n=1 Tax=Brevibacillus dissolubilis TaxID=1844116 RepID=UPI001116077F|nr:MarR family transcriptional regulator [Brevibacillus dissolubilis]
MQDRKTEYLQEFQTIFEDVFVKMKKKTGFPKTEYKLATGHIFVLLNLVPDKVRTATELANALGVTSGAVTGLTDKLVSFDLINRVRSEEDRRVVQFSLTEKGMDVVHQVRKDRAQTFVNLFSNLPEEDIVTIVEVFKKLNSVLE